MTELGLCHNAAFPASCLTDAHVAELRPKWVRTITYWRDDRSLWQATVDCCRRLADLGVKNLLIFNTEAFGGQVDDLDLMAQRLDEFLSLANGAVHAIEPGNELDTPGWTDSRGQPISDDLIIATGRRAAEICHRYGVLCLSPSLLSGPTQGHFERIAAGLAGFCDAMAVHPYGRSIGGQPSPGWLFGTVEEAADQCRDLGSGMRTWFTELGCWTAAGDRGFEGQRGFIEELKKFEHPWIERVFYFTAFDTAVPVEELQQGKDWGMMDLAGQPKPCCQVFDGGLVLAAPPQPVGARFALGFKKLHDLAPDIVGDPLENEFGLTEGWSAQRTTNGWLFWSDLKQGEKLAFFHNDGRRFLWSEAENWSELRPISPPPQMTRRPRRSATAPRSEKRRRPARAQPESRGGARGGKGQRRPAKAARGRTD